MAQYIEKSAVVAEIKKRIKETESMQPKFDQFWAGQISAFKGVLKIIDTLEVIDPYEQCVQYDSIKAGIQAHAETYSFNIESELFNQLTKEQQKLWRKEIEQACVSGGEVGVELARDPRYKENIKEKEVDLEKEFDDYTKDILACDVQFEPFTHLHNCAKHFFELGIKAQKGE